MVVLYYLLLFQKVMYKWCIFDLLSVAYISGKATLLEGSMIWFDISLPLITICNFCQHACDVKGMKTDRAAIFFGKSTNL